MKKFFWYEPSNKATLSKRQKHNQGGAEHKAFVTMFMCVVVMQLWPSSVLAGEMVLGDDAPHSIQRSRYIAEAMAGDPEAQYQLGLLYQAGHLEKSGEREARHWFEKSAAQGHAEAQNMVGAMLIANAANAQGRLGGVELLKKSAAKGNASAQHNLGLAYQYGWGVARDEIVAVSWFQKAAAQNESSAHFWVGRAYETGTALQRDEQLAVASYRKGAKLGDAAAQSALGGMYSAGRGGLPASASDMRYWTERAADQGFATAMYNLGVIHEKGLGVPADYVNAYTWFNLAADKGVAEAQEALARVEKLIVPSQIAEAQRRSREWRPRSAAASSLETGAPISEKKAGSGFFVSSSGQLLTNYHVVQGCRQLVVQPEQQQARLLATDSTNDLALLATDRPVSQFARFRAGSRVVRGEEIAIVGFPPAGYARIRNQCYGWGCQRERRSRFRRRQDEGFSTCSGR